MNFQRIAITLFSISFLLNSCSITDQKVKNLHAFAKVYGYVRWFYPSDEASKINWDRFAVYGVQKVENAQNEKELQKTLLDLFKPIAPAIKIESEKQVTNFNIQSITPNDTNGLIPIEWQHYGVNLGKQSNMYESERINREDLNKRRTCLYKTINNITEFKGREIKLIVSLKHVKNSKGNVYLYLFSYDSESLTKIDSFRKNTSLVRTDEDWKNFEKFIKVGKTDNRIVLGLGIDNSSIICIDEVKLMVRINNKWKPVKLDNGIFTERLKEWNIDEFRYNYKLVNSQKKDRKYTLIINRNKRRIGEIIKKEIGSHLICTMPTVLYGDSLHTYPVSDVKSINEQLKNIPKNELTSDNIKVKIANVIIAWNVLQHFYPYFDVVQVDWEKELSQTLYNVYLEKSELDFFKDLSKMIAKLNDGHGVVYSDKIQFWGLPFSVDWIEKNIVVTASLDTSLFKKGDIIESIDHKTALEALKKQESLISGSSQLKRFRALNVFGCDFSQSYADVTIIRDKEKKSFKVQRKTKSSIFFNTVNQYYLPTFRDLGNSIYYLNLCDWQSEEKMAKLLKAKGIIINLLKDEDEFLSHIIKNPVWSPRMNIPENLLPDRKNTIFDTIRWKIEPKKPYIGAKLVFLTNPGHVSSGETSLGIVDYYRLGKLVGDTTAGTNGNANFIPLIGGYSIMWTGMKVLKHDGSQHHLIGFKPDYPVHRTISAIMEEKDEYIEKAKNLLN
jgi:hypothetical protein